jgi:F-type H+-transporting ATPase subunit delta
MQAREGQAAMASSGAARRYVQAIVEIARERQSFDAWERDLGRLDQMVADPQVATFLDNPSASEADKTKAVDLVLADAQPEARNLARLLVERQRTGLIPDIVDGFRDAALAERGVVVADITTAEPLDDTMQAAVRERLGQMVGKTVELRLHTDPAIIGGLVARIGDQVIDGSVQTRLRRLRTRLRAS